MPSSVSRAKSVMTLRFVLVAFSARWVASATDSEYCDSYSDLSPVNSTGLLQRGVPGPLPSLESGIGPVQLVKSLSKGDMSKIAFARHRRHPGDILGGTWLRRAHWDHKLPQPKNMGIHQLIFAAEVEEWAAFALVLIAALVVRHVWHWPGYCSQQPRCRIFWPLFGWIMLALAVSACVFARFGVGLGKDWIAGYFVELFFMVENVFVFRVIVTAVKLPESSFGRALNVVVCGQIVFEALLFVGLAHHLRMLRILPHVLGLLLVYLGITTIAEASSSAPPVGRSSESEDSLSSKVIRRISSAASLSDTDITPADQFFYVADGKLQLSVLGLAVGLLLTADFIFEIDTVLTKVDEIANPFIAFTSSALAAFALPEMFMASQELLLHFPSFKIGLGAVLCMFGMQMMLAPLVVLHPFATCLVMFGILIISVLPSLLCCAPVEGM